MKVVRLLLRVLIIAFIGILLSSFIMLGYLYFFQGSSIFGVQLLNYSSIAAKKVQYDYNYTTDIDEIYINSEDYNVIVKPYNVDNDTVVIIMENEMLGFVKKSENVFDVTFEQSQTALYINVISPTVLGSINNQTVTIYLPKSIHESVMKMEIITQEGDITIGYSSKDKDEIAKYVMKFDDIYTESTNGNVILQNCNLTNQLEVVIGSGLFDIYDNCSLSLDTTILKVDDGLIDFQKTYEEKDIYYYVYYDLGNITITNTGAGSVRLGEVDNVYYSGSEGELNIITVNEISAEADSTVINISTIINSSFIKLNKFGGVTVDYSYSYLDIETYNGYITVKVPYEKLRLQSVGGDIKVEKSFAPIYAQNSSGNINITFDEECEDYNSSDMYRYTETLNKNGKTVIAGAMLVDAEATGSGSIYIEYKEVYYQSSNITTNSGNMTIIIPSEKEFVALISDIGGLFDVYVNGINYDNSEQNEFVFFTEDNDITGILKILKVTSISGNLKIRDEVNINK